MQFGKAFFARFRKQMVAAPDVFDIRLNSMQRRPSVAPKWPLFRRRPTRLGA